MRHPCPVFFGFPALSRLAGVGLALLLLAHAAQAEQTPRSGGRDARVRVVSYHPMDVIRVTASPTHSTQILFAEGEEISQVAIGDAENWLAQPAGNALFLKPTAPRASSNMQVVTRTANGTARSYQFVLAEGPPIFALHVTPREDRRASADAERAREARLAQAWAEGPRNWRYVAQGSGLLEPLEVSDNGRFTAFRFPGAMRLPAIFTVAPDGSETIVSYTVVGDHVVVPRTAKEFLLRDGREVLRVVNQGFDPIGRDPGTGTGLPDLVRVVRGTAP